jgi:hypothetical protein
MTQAAEIKTTLNYETAKDGTVYWTLSLYIDPARAAEVLGYQGRIPTEIFRQQQTDHAPSRALRDAINPLMNDIADREVLGELHDFLLAADDNEAEDRDGDLTARGFIDLTFRLPSSLSWQTEGRRYTASPPRLDEKRSVRLRRFWMAHNNGALSYHLSFTHCYADHADHTGQDAYSPATYYFLSCLQKLAAPKEFWVEKGGDQRPDEKQPSVFDANLGIASLDAIKVFETGASGDEFWPFVAGRFETDARNLFRRLVGSDREIRVNDSLAKDLLKQVSFIEVPGLLVPRSRFQFFIHDRRFFDRLMPEEPETQEPVSRRGMVRAGCYELIRDLNKGCETTVQNHRRSVNLDEDYWHAVLNRQDWKARLADGRLWTEGRLGAAKRLTVNDEEAAIEALRVGNCWLSDGTKDKLKDMQKLHLRSFEWSRPDCLDYLFLAGFNQNIIDFMNQDTSEILDATDPLYPSKDSQAAEGFFVRYANHRAMITYVKSSRSLEAGNDYIGTCPYAFLIHVTALHNEFLGRDHEAACMAGIEEIKDLIERKLFDKAEKKINALKLSEFSDYEQYAYGNPFRYDTERDVFDELQKLRGVMRKQDAIQKAVASLEDHAADLHRNSENRRSLRLNILLGSLGLYGAGQMFYWIGEKAQGENEPWLSTTTPRPLVFQEAGNEAIGDRILSLTELIIIGGTALLLVGLVFWAGLWLWTRLTNLGAVRSWLTKRAPERVRKQNDTKRERGRG